jgi:hypothetical protein
MTLVYVACSKTLVQVVLEVRRVVKEIHQIFQVEFVFRDPSRPDIKIPEAIRTPSTSTGI